MQIVHTKRLEEVLLRAGLIDEQTHRVVIDLEVGELAIIRTEKYADERLLELLGVAVAEVAEN